MSGSGNAERLRAVLELPLWDGFATIDAQTALQESDKALLCPENKPKEARVKLHRLRGHAYASLKQYGEAKSEFEKVLKLSPDDYESRCLRARILILLGNEKEGAEECERIIHEAPRLALPYILRGQLQYYRGQLKACTESMTEAIRLVKYGDRNVAPAFAVRGVAYLAQGDRERALKDLTDAMTISPADGGMSKPGAVHLWRARVLVSLGFHQVAVESINAARHLNPGLPEPYDELWWVYCDLGLDEVCRDVASQVSKLKGGAETGALRLAMSLNCLRRHDEAIQQGLKLVQLNPKALEAYREIGLGYAALGKTALARENLEKAAGVDHVDSLLCCAWFLATSPDEKVRDGNKARKLAAKACSLTERKDYTALFVLAAAKAECGDYSDAVSVLREILSQAQDQEFRHSVEKFQQLYSISKPYRSSVDDAQPHAAGNKPQRPSSWFPGRLRLTKMSPESS
jgi:tetratricopeptide (TPR) repeat protein